MDQVIWAIWTAIKWWCLISKLQLDKFSRQELYIIKDFHWMGINSCLMFRSCCLKQEMQKRIFSFSISCPLGSVYLETSLMLLFNSAAARFLQGQNMSDWFGLVCVLYWHLFSVRTFGVMYDHTSSELANYQINIWPRIKWAVSLVIAYGLQFSSGVCVGTYGLTYSVYHPSRLKHARSFLGCNEHYRVELPHQQLAVIWSRGMPHFFSWR